MDPNNSGRSLCKILEEVDEPELPAHSDGAGGQQESGPVEEEQAHGPAAAASSAVPGDLEGPWMPSGDLLTRRFSRLKIGDPVQGGQGTGAAAGFHDDAVWWSPSPGQSSLPSWPLSPIVDPPADQLVGKYGPVGSPIKPDGARHHSLEGRRPNVGHPSSNPWPIRRALQQEPVVLPVGREDGPVPRRSTPLSDEGANSWSRSENPVHGVDVQWGPSFPATFPPGGGLGPGVWLHPNAVAPGGGQPSRNVDQVGFWNRSSRVGARPSRECKFCRNNGEPAAQYQSHVLRHPSTGRLICPVLRSHVCETCGATGDDAHTRNYCPEVNREKKLRLALPLHLKSTRRQSNGQVRNRQQ